MPNLSSYKFIKNDRVGVVVEYNAVVKTFSSGVSKIRFNSYSNMKGMFRDNKKNGSSTEEQLERYRQKRLHQRREQIRDLAYNFSAWQYFVTLTFDDDFFTNSIYSHDEAIKLLKKWLNNQRKQNPDMIYLVVPELTETGRLHFHGLFARVPKWRLSPAFSAKTGRPIYKNGCRIYNLANYELGFTTISKIKSVDKVSFYISKYMTKQLLNLRNRKNFWHSRNLMYPQENYYLTDYEEIRSYLNDCIIEHENVSKTSNSTSYFAKYRIFDNI